MSFDCSASLFTSGFRSLAPHGTWLIQVPYET
jgi:hypothetical protein